MKRYVSYLRVSTQKQGIQGLGMEAQRSAVTQFINGGSILLKEFVEVESGKNDKRNELKAAIQYCKENDAELVIAKLDRLSRNASFVFALRDSGVRFVCCDMPDANNLTIGIIALLAQNEREAISTRTKAALAEKKKQGFKLGNNNLTAEGVKNSIATRRENRDEHNKKALLTAQSLRKLGSSYKKIADKLNDAGFLTIREKKYHSQTVKRMLEVN